MYFSIQHRFIYWQNLTRTNTMGKQTWGYTYSLYISLVQICTCIKISIHGHIFCLTSEMWMCLIKLPSQTHWVCLVTRLKLDEFWSPDTSDPRGLGTVALLGTLLNLPFVSVVWATSQEGDHSDHNVFIPCAKDSLSQARCGHRINLLRVPWQRTTG